MTPRALHPIWYVITVTSVVISAILIINLYQEKANVYAASQLRLRQLENSLEETKLEAEKKAKDLNRFQQKKYGIEPINPEDAYSL